MFEYANALPRAAIFYGAELASDSEAALSRLKTIPDVWTHAVITDSSAVSAAVRAELKRMQNTARRRAEPATIVAHESMRVRIVTQTKTPGLLVLTDSNYPGWNVYIDGNKAPLLDANYLFRGVVVPAGHHTIEFLYEPRSYAYGFGITALSILGLAFVGMKRRVGKSTNRLSELLGMATARKVPQVTVQQYMNDDANLAPGEDTTGVATPPQASRRRRRPKSQKAGRELL